MSPKSLLRHKQAVSDLEDFTEDQFHNVLAETDEMDVTKIRRLVICSGKVYYDLRDKRRELELDDVAIVRVEQLYPFPDAELWQAINFYQHLESVVWCQEEPKNQGAWYNSQHRLRRVLAMIAPALDLEFSGRASSAAPAAGHMALHLQQQDALVAEALGIDVESESS